MYIAIATSYLVSLGMSLQGVIPFLTWWIRILITHLQVSYLPELHIQAGISPPLLVMLSVLVEYNVPASCSNRREHHDCLPHHDSPSMFLDHFDPVVRWCAPYVFSFYDGKTQTSSRL